MRTTIDLHGRHLLTVDDYSREEIVYLLNLAADLKQAKVEGHEEHQLEGKQIAVILERDSIRTRCAFEAAANDQGARVTFIGPTGARIGDNETVKDTARVLGRMYDAIEYRGCGVAVADELARWAGVPVYNGLTDEWHPTQLLAAFLTFDERVPRPLDQVRLCYLGDARFTMADTYLVGAAKMGMDVRIASPKSLWPRQGVVETAQRAADVSGGHVTITEDLEEAVTNCDVLLTDVWVSMDEPAEAWKERIDLLLPYQVNARSMELTGNPEVKFTHWRPALHNTDTAVGTQLFDRYGLEALEVTDDVFESPVSLVFDEAENRMHTIKAVLVATLGD